MASKKASGFSFRKFISYFGVPSDAFVCPDSFAVCYLCPHITIVVDLALKTIIYHLFLLSFVQVFYFVFCSHTNVPVMLNRRNKPFPTEM